MELTRNHRPSTQGSSDWFTGHVHIDAVATPRDRARLAAAHVHFAPGARTAWHRHPNGQTLWVTDGVGRAQRRGGPVEEIRPGDTVFFDPDEEHWHGAAPDRFMSHLAMQEADASGRTADWGDHVTDAEYLGQAPAS